MKRYVLSVTAIILVVCLCAVGAFASETATACDCGGMYAWVTRNTSEVIGSCAENTNYYHTEKKKYRAYTCDECGYILDSELLNYEVYCAYTRDIADHGIAN